MVGSVCLIFASPGCGSLNAVSESTRLLIMQSISLLVKVSDLPATKLNFPLGRKIWIRVTGLISIG